MLCSTQKRAIIIVLDFVKTGSLNIHESVRCDLGHFGSCITTVSVVLAIQYLSNSYCYVRHVTLGLRGWGGGRSG